MKIQNVSGADREIAHPDHRPVFAAAGDTVEVDDKLGERLLEQPANWAKPTTPKTKTDKGAGPEEID